MAKRITESLLEVTFFCFKTGGSLEDMISFIFCLFAPRYDMVSFRALPSCFIFKVSMLQSVGEERKSLRVCSSPGSINGEPSCEIDLLLFCSDSKLFTLIRESSYGLELSTTSALVSPTSLTTCSKDKSRNKCMTGCESSPTYSGSTHFLMILSESLPPF